MMASSSILFPSDPEPMSGSDSLSYASDSPLLQNSDSLPQLDMNLPIPNNFDSLLSAPDTGLGSYSHEQTMMYPNPAMVCVFSGVS